MTDERAPPDGGGPPQRVVKIEIFYLGDGGSLPDLQEPVNVFLGGIPSDDVISVQMIIYTAPVVMVTYVADAP